MKCLEGSDLKGPSGPAFFLIWSQSDVPAKSPMEVAVPTRQLVFRGTNFHLAPDKDFEMV